jgi:N-acetylglucosaminyldiphosphoundecaprenol N-acetyl-beta-D-mannosaminyltransferase
MGVSVRSPERLSVGGVVIDFVPPDDAVDLVVSRAARGAVHLCNAYTVALADERADVAHALVDARLNLPDGTPLAWYARRRGLKGCVRVYGPDLMRGVLDRGRATGLTHYLYGSTEQVLADLVGAINESWPGAEIVGTESPPFRELTDAEIRAAASRADSLGADVVWVGMGTPKQDLLVSRMAMTGQATYIAVGAAFDFLSGNKPQAPRAVQRMGLEWLFRLISEPRRLARRYLVYNLHFLRLLVKSPTPRLSETADASPPDHCAPGSMRGRPALGEQSEREAARWGP